MNLTNLHKILKSQLGFSLPEVMVGGAILAGVGLAGAYIFKEQKLAQKRVDHDQTLATFHNNLIKKLNSSNNCNATLSSFYGGTITGSLNAFYECTANCDNFELEANGFSTSRAEFLRVNDWIDNTEVWRVAGINFTSTFNASGAVSIRVSYQMNPKIHSKTITKQILLNTRFTTSQNFLECASADESALTNLQNDLCRDIGKAGSVVSNGVIGTNGSLAYWDEATQSCISKGSSTNKLKECPAGFVVRGVRSDGVVHCQPVNDNFNPTDVQQGTKTNTCATGQKATLSYEGGQVVIKCI